MAVEEKLAPKQPGYLVVHEDGSVDVIRMTPDQSSLYAEILLGLASQLLAQYRTSLAKVPEDNGDF